MLTFSGALEYAPNDDLSIRLNGYYSDDDIAPPSVSTLLPNCEPNSSGVNQTYCGELPSIDKDDLSSHPDAYGQKRESWRWSLNGDYTFDSGWSLSSLTGFNKVSVDAVTDITRGQGATYLYNTNPATFPPMTSVFSADLLRFDPTVEVEEFSQELRLHSPSEKSVRGSAGLFYYDFERIAPQPVVRSLTDLPSDFQSFMPPFAGDAIYGGFFQNQSVAEVRTIDVTDASVFGSLEADVTDKVTLRGELRYSHEEQSLDIDTGGSGSETFKTWTGRFTADYSPDANTLIYSSIGRGAKAGGFDVDDLNAPFGPEYNVSYDLGVKRTLENGRGMFDVAAFFIDRTDVQTPLLDVGLNPPVAVTTNLGDAESYGIEAEMRYNLTEALNLRLGSAWTKSKINSGKSSGYAQYSQFAPDGDISGQPLGRTPEWQFNGSLDYNARLTGDWDWFWRVDANYQSDQFSNPSALTIIPERTIVNLRIGVDRGAWRMELFAENAFDEDAPVSSFNDVYFGTLDTGSFAIYPWRTTVNHGRRRVLGGRLSAEF